MDTSFLISVIVPVFNSADTLSRCIDSILGQTYTNLEVIIINDGSTDSSAEIIAQYAQSDNRIKTWEQENRGLSVARNIGLDNACGEYIAFIDSDDWIEPNTYEKLISTCQKYIAEVGICGHFTDYQEKSILSQPCAKPELIIGKTAVYQMVVERTISYACWDKLWKRDLFSDIRFPKGHVYEDRNTTCRLLQKTARIILIPTPLYHYVQCENSICHTRSAKNLADEWLAAKHLYEAFSMQDGTFKQACLRQCFRDAVRIWCWVYILSDEEKKQYKDLINEINRFVRAHWSEGIRDRRTTGIAKFGIILTRYNLRWSFRMAYYLNQIRHKLDRLTAFPANNKYGGKEHQTVYVL